MRPIRRPDRAQLILCMFLFPLILAAQAPASPASKPAARVCTIVRTPPTEGEIDLARTAYTKAESFYRAAVEHDGTSSEANLGLVRALVGEDEATEAVALATAFFNAHPGDALAETALGEADYRAGNLTDARSHFIAAVNADGCEGRSLADFATLLGDFAFYATQARYLAKAHAFRPNDELIRRDWIYTLPRKQREAELAQYLVSAQAISESERKALNNEEEHLKAYRPGECRITSKAPANTTMKVPFEFIYGDSPVPQAYGLDVSFDGKRRRLQIDTGASGITLSPAAARRLGITPEFQTKTGGVGDEGEVGSYLAHVAKIDIGDVELTDCMVEVLEKSKLDVDGLVGMNIFHDWLVTLDYPNAKLMLDTLPPRPEVKATAAGTESPANSNDETRHDAIVPPSEKDWLHVIRIGHELLLPASINGGPIHYMIADTGASLTSLSLAFAKESGKAHTEESVQVTGISGKVKKTFSIEGAHLQFGNMRLPPGSFYAFDITGVSHDAGTEVSGFVGLDTLSRVSMTIDYRDNLLDFKYDQKKDFHRF